MCQCYSLITTQRSLHNTWMHSSSRCWIRHSTFQTCSSPTGLQNNKYKWGKILFIGIRRGAVGSVTLGIHNLIAFPERIIKIWTETDAEGLNRLFATSAVWISDFEEVVHLYFPLSCMKTELRNKTKVHLGHVGFVSDNGKERLKNVHCIQRKCLILLHKRLCHSCIWWQRKAHADIRISMHTGQNNLVETRGTDFLLLSRKMYRNSGKS